jgi:hypothetical protein
MKILRAVVGTLAAFFLTMIAPAYSQGLSGIGNESNLSSPMSLLPDGVAIPKAGSFNIIGIDPQPVPQKAALVIPLDPPKPQRLPTRSIAPQPEAVDPEKPAEKAEKAQDKTAVALLDSAAVPMPPRRPFNLGLGRKQKPLLAKAALIEGTASRVESKAIDSDARSLVALEELPGVRIKGNGLVQQASISTGSRSDAVAPEEVITPRGQDFGGSGSIIKQTPSVQIGCFPPSLRALLNQASRRFGRAVVVTSGMRGNGRRGSYHRKCMAADVKIEGVAKQTLAAYFRSLPGAGGVGTYCHNGVVHIDVAEPRNWTYCGFRRTSFSLRGGGWSGNRHVRAGQPLPDGADEGDD